MSECANCGKRGIFVAVDTKKLCKQCQHEVYGNVARTKHLIGAATLAINKSGSWHERLEKCHLILDSLKAFEAVENKGIKGLFGQPLREMIEEYERFRDEVLSEDIQRVINQARSGLRAERGEGYQGKREVLEKTGVQLRKMQETYDRAMRATHRTTLLKMKQDNGYQKTIFDPALRELQVLTEKNEAAHLIDVALAAETGGNLEDALEKYKEALYYLTIKVGHLNDLTTIEKIESRIRDLGERCSAQI